MRLTAISNASKRTIFADGRIGLLQMILESVTRPCEALVGVGLKRTISTNGGDR